MPRFLTRDLKIGANQEKASRNSVWSLDLNHPRIAPLSA
jgi:hypothetical protein